MAITNSTGLKNAQLDRLFNGSAGTNFNSGLLRIYASGGSPPGVDAAQTGTLLWEETLPADAFDAAASGSISKLGTWEATASGTGTADYFRLVKSGDLGTNNTTDERIQGSVTASGGGGDMTLQNTSVASGQSITISTATITHG